MKRATLFKIAGVVAGVFLLNVAWLAYVHRELAIYSWDFDNYWARCRSFQLLLENHPAQFPIEVLRSIRNADYTAEPILLPVFLISLGQAMHVLAYSRASYILAVGNIYLVPASLVLIWFVSILRDRRLAVPTSPGAIPASVWLAGALILLLTPGLWLPMLRGYPDGGGLIFCFLVTMLFLRLRHERRETREDVLSWSAIVVLLVGLVFFRRWYLYWIFWFWVGAGIVSLWDAVEEWRSGSRWSATLRRPVEFFAAGLAFGLLVFLVSPVFLHKVFAASYVDQCSFSMLSKTVGEFLLNTFSTPGIVGILLFAGGIACGLSFTHLRKLAVLQLVQLIGIVVQFGMIQDFGPHHHYLLFAVMLPFATLCVATLLERYRWRAAACLLPIGLASSILSFTTPAFTSPTLLSFVVGAVDGAPLRRGDLPEWRRLTATMDTVLRTRGAGRIFVLASTNTINSACFLSINRSLHEAYSAPSFVDSYHEIDRRDGFPLELLKDKYVILADPIQIQFDPSFQQIVELPANEFLSDSGIARAFQELPYRFTLDGGVNVSIFEKTRPIRDSEVRLLSHALRQVYPDRPYIYDPRAAAVWRRVNG